MRLGFPEKVLAEGGLRERDPRRWQSGPHLRTSIGYVHAIVDQLERLDLRVYRISQGIAPYASHPDLPQFHHQVEECADELAGPTTSPRRSSWPAAPGCGWCST